MNKDPIRKFEHSNLKIGEQGFTAEHFNALVKYNDHHNSKYFTVGHKKIKFNSYVGVIQVGDQVIEILPKGDKSNDTSKWKSALIQMLKVAKYVNLDLMEDADLKSSRNHLLEILFQSYLTEVSKLIRAGLVKKYITVSKNTTALKGKLVFTKHISKNSFHKERFFNEFNHYSQNNVFNQIIKLALTIIKNLTNSLSLSATAKSLILSFDHVEDIGPKNINFNRIILDRKTRSYAKAIILAKMIIQNYSVDIQKGSMPLIAFLFDMNTLFEDFILRSLKKEEAKFSKLSLSIKGQKRFKFWNYKEIRPDIIVDYEKHGQKKRVIIDTKWKVLNELKPSDGDLKQIYVYNIQLNSDHGILLYPYSGLENLDNKNYRESRLLQDFTHSCSISFIDPFDRKGHISKDFAHDYLSSIIY